MNDCIVLIGKKGLFDNAAAAVQRRFEGTLTDVVFVDESELGLGSGIKGYILASRYCPSLSGAFLKKFYKRYKVKEQKPQKFKQGKLPRVVPPSERCENVLYRFAPKAVVCFTSRALALTLSAAGTTGYKGCVIAGALDFAPACGMSVKGADVYFAATDESGEILARRGIERGRIKVTGMPVTPSGAARDKALKQLGISGEKPVAFIAGGRYCSRRAMRAAQAFSAYSDVLTPLLSGGERGADFVEKHCPDVIVAAEESMDVLYAAADIAVIAPTAFIAAECAANGLPVVLLPPVNKAQKGVYKALKKIYPAAKSEEEAVKLAMELIMDKSAQERCRAAARELLPAGGEERLTGALKEVLERYKDIEVFPASAIEEGADNDGSHTDPQEDGE